MNETVSQWPAIRFGTCSWNYPSWEGLVYPTKSPGQRKKSVDYLADYARALRSVEIDSWFYAMPDADQVQAYAEAVDADFRFSIKVPARLCMTHERHFVGGRPSMGLANADFLSPAYFEAFLERTLAIHPLCSALIFEFEYMNRQKMSGLQEFIDRCASFFRKFSGTPPLAIELRNGNYLESERAGSWFSFLAESNIVPVLSQKLHLPDVRELCARCLPQMGPALLFRLMGDDRGEIEKLTGDRWGRRLMPKPELPALADLFSELIKLRKLIVNVNNHYEGSSPRTIALIYEAMQPATDSVWTTGFAYQPLAAAEHNTAEQQRGASQLDLGF